MREFFYAAGELGITVGDTVGFETGNYIPVGSFCSMLLLHSRVFTFGAGPALLCSQSACDFCLVAELLWCAQRGQHHWCAQRCRAHVAHRGAVCAGVAGLQASTRTAPLDLLLPNKLT